MTGSQAPVAAVALREATFADYDQIAALAARYRLRPRDRQEWRHVWTDNAEYLRHKNWPIGWVLERPGGEVVGSVLRTRREKAGSRRGAGLGRR